eukprot:10763726-Heterocapsa_arctica.AAC.1
MQAQQNIQQAEKDNTETNYFQQNKKPRTEDKQYCKNNMLELLKRRKENQDHDGSAQRTKKRNPEHNVDRVTPVAGTIATFFQNRSADDRGSEGDACPPGRDPRANTDVSAAGAERPRYSEHPA